MDTKKAVNNRKIQITITISSHVLEMLDNRVAGSRSGFIECAILNRLEKDLYDDSTLNYQLNELEDMNEIEAS